VQLVNRTFSDVGAKEDVTADALLGMLDRWIARRVDWEAIAPFETLGIDEIALLKGHRDFVAVISAQTKAGHVQVLAVLPDRLKATVVAWRKTIPASIQSRISTVCTDMWEGYITAVQEVLPRATLVIARVHVAQPYRDGVDELRKQDVRRLRHELPKAAQEQFKQTLWPFRKRATKLKAEEKARLDVLLVASPTLKEAYSLREELTTIFDTAGSKAEGLERIAAWRQKVERSGLNCFAAFLKLLDRWVDLITNYFLNRKTRGFVEGLNNKLKVLKRRCYGLSNVTRLFQRLTLDLEGYCRFSPWHTVTP
jgi:transposase